MINDTDPYHYGEVLDRRQAGPLTTGWGFSLPIVVRFRDLDVFDHVNNAVYLSYCEMARGAYYYAVLQMPSRQQSTFILAHVGLDYRAPVELDDPLRVLVRSTGIGTKSLTMEYRLLVTHEGHERIACEGRSVQVAYDYVNKRSIPMPSEAIAALEAFEGRSLRGLANP